MGEGPGADPRPSAICSPACGARRRPARPGPRRTQGHGRRRRRALQRDGRGGLVEAVVRVAQAEGPRRERRDPDNQRETQGADIRIGVREVECARLLQPVLDAGVGEQEVPAAAIVEAEQHRHRLRLAHRAAVADIEPFERFSDRGGEAPFQLVSRRDGLRQTGSTRAALTKAGAAVIVLRVGAAHGLYGAGSPDLGRRHHAGV